jgi:hypothetical protein
MVLLVEMGYENFESNSQFDLDCVRSELIAACWTSEEKERQ